MRCRKCGHDKNETEFYRRSNGKLQDCCKSCYIARTGDYQRKEKDAVDARARDRYARDPEKYRERSREWAAAHPEARHEIQRRSDRKHPRSAEDNYIYCSNRRARSKNAEGSFTKDEWEQLKAQYGNRCVACGDDGPLTADHVVPLILGGTNYITNIQPLCRSCNSSKNDKIIDYRRM